jgi:hypothetical protein
MPEPLDRITIVDLRIPFFRLMMFFIKASLAAIPAAIVVAVILIFLSAVVAALFGDSMHFMMRRWTL